MSQAGHSSSPVTAISLNGQILYAVTGGGYEPIDSEGRVLGQRSTSQAQLVVADISDPVHPIIIDKLFIDKLFPYHMNITLPPDGFREIKVDGVDMYLIGGNRLYHLDTTLPAEPLLLNEEVFAVDDVVNGVTVADDLIYVSGNFGLKIYRKQPDRNLLLLRELGVAQLGGTPTTVAVHGEILRVMLPGKAKILELELMAGDFTITNTISLLDMAGNPVTTATSMLARDNHLFVSTGRSGLVILYGIKPDNTTAAVAQFPLAYLVRNGDLFAGDMLLYGQTLYVAAGQGDVQLFDIAPWLDHRYAEQLQLRHYFSVTGDVGAIAFGGDAIYAGTSFVYVDDKPAENPIPVGVGVGNLGGALNTIVNDQLMISEQVPAPRGKLPVNDAVELQFNRILDNTQLATQGDQLLTVTLNGVAVNGFVSSLVNNSGTRLYFRPAQPFIDDREYRVTLSGAVMDLHGETLTRDYSFRFVSYDAVMPRIDDVRPSYGSWRGGEEVTILGENFDLFTEIEIAGEVVPSTNVISVQPGQIKFRLPALRAPPEENKVVGLALSNGQMRSSVLPVLSMSQNR